MGWENRGENGPYYTRSTRCNGRVVREYIGGGLIGEICHLVDMDRRNLRELDKEILRFDLESLSTADRDMAAMYRQIQMLVHAYLQNSGFHQHNRGEWRRVRNAKKE